MPHYSAFHSDLDHIDNNNKERKHNNSAIIHTTATSNTKSVITSSAFFSSSSSSSATQCSPRPSVSNPKTPSRSSVFSSPSVSSSSSTHNTKTPKSYNNDRFIPNRDTGNSDYQLHTLNNENSAPNNRSSLSSPTRTHTAHNVQLAQSLFNTDELNSKILAFKQKAPKPSEGHQSHLRVLYTQNREAILNNTAAGIIERKKASYRHIATAPERVLDAPNMCDDYYLNLLHWSPQNLLAVALGNAVYLWDASSGEIDLLCECGMEGDGDMVTSVSWMMDGSHLAIGTHSSLNDVQLWNIAAKKQVRSLKGHEARVGSLAWNQHLLSSGSRDSSIIHHDVRIAQHKVAVLKGHTQEICGLKWNAEGSQLASGGNDNQCCIWDLAASTTSTTNPTHQQPRYIFNEACAAVKALAWCPFLRNTLATGAGTADRHIRFYNTITGTLLHSLDTQSQVTSLQWSLNGDRELLSSHGFSQNQLSVWKYPSMVKMADLEGHTSRILHTAMSPDGSVVVSAAADETLRFWRVWEGGEKKRKDGSTASLSSATGAAIGKHGLGGSKRVGLTMSMR